MSFPLSRLALSLACLFAAPLLSAATFTYHGELQRDGAPAEGRYDLELTLYSTATGGSVVAGPMTVYGVPVAAGNFSTDVDFGPLAKAGAGAWVGVRLRAAGDGDFETLPARSFVESTTAAVCPGAWTLVGNAGNPAGSYLGTGDNQPVVIKANASRVLQLTPQVGIFGVDAPNILAGGASNTNDAADYAQTVSGGFGNGTAGSGGTVAGGAFCKANGFMSVAPGGYSNIAGGDYSFAAGNYAKVRSAADVGSGTTGDKGSFVWSDSTATSNAPFVSAGNDQFLLRASGGVGINTNNTTSFALSTFRIQGNTAPSGNGDTLRLDPPADGSRGTNSSHIQLGSTGDWLIRSGKTTGKIALQDQGGVVTVGNTAAPVVPSLLNVGGGVTVGNPTTPSISKLLRVGGGVQIGNPAVPAGTNMLDVGGGGSFAGSVVVSGGQLAVNNPTYPALYVTGGLFMQGDYSSDGNGVMQGKLSVGGGMSSSATALTVYGVAEKPGGGSWAVFSDRRLKQDIAPIDRPLDRLLALHGTEYEYIPGKVTECIAGPADRLHRARSGKCLPRLGRHGCRRLQIRQRARLRSAERRGDARTAAATDPSGR